MPKESHELRMLVMNELAAQPNAVQHGQINNLHLPIRLRQGFEVANRKRRFKRLHVEERNPL